MNTLKFIALIEIVAMFVCVGIHIASYFLREDFPLLIYPSIAGIMLVVCLFVIYVFTPFADWFLK